MELLIVLVFVSAGATVLAIGNLNPATRATRRLAKLADGSVGVVATPTHDPRKRPTSHFGRVMASVATRFTDTDDLSAAPIRKRLVEGGYRRPSAVLVYQGSRIVLALACPLMVLAASPFYGLEQLELFTGLAAAIAFGYVAPSQFVDRQRAKRQFQIIRGMPDALDLMVVCVEAGLGINASLARISREFAATNPVLASEFELVTLEIRAGKSTTGALRSLAQRSGVSEVAALVAMLVQTERFGTSLADTLRVHAEGMRVQRMLRAEEQAGKAPLKMMFPTLLIFAATLLVTLGPGLLQLIGFFSEKQ